MKALKLKAQGGCFARALSPDTWKALKQNDCETFLDALDKHNRLSHTYNESMAMEAEKLIKIRYLPTLLKLRQRLESKRGR